MNNFQILIIFIDIYVTVLHLCTHLLMTSIIFYIPRLNIEENISLVLGFYISSDVNISHFEELETCLSHLSISLNDLCTREFREFF